MLGKNAWRIEDRTTRDEERVGTIERTVHAIRFVGLNSDRYGGRKSRDKLTRMMRSIAHDCRVSHAIASVDRIEDASQNGSISDMIAPIRADYNDGMQRVGTIQVAPGRPQDTC